MDKTRRVFVSLPNNLPSGGNKVGNQLVNLFRSRGFESYLVLPREVRSAGWMIEPAPVIHLSQFKQLCRRQDILIENWYDREVVAESMTTPASIKIYYPQASVFYKSQTLLGDELLLRDFGYTHFWAVSHPSRQVLERHYPRIRRWHVVHPYFEFEKSQAVTGGLARKDEVLTFPRKGRLFLYLMRLRHGVRTRFRGVRSFTEREAYELMASHKYFLATATGATSQGLRNFLRLLRYGDRSRCLYLVPDHGHREGFPLPPAEAAMCGAIVIGFAMGGGLEWMAPSNCFLAKDRDYFSLNRKFQEALCARPETLEEIRTNAFRAVRRFDRENTWSQIQDFFRQEAPHA